MISTYLRSFVRFYGIWAFVSSWFFGLQLKIQNRYDYFPCLTENNCSLYLDELKQTHVELSPHNVQMKTFEKAICNCGTELK